MSKPRNLAGQVIGNMYLCPRDKVSEHPGKTMLAGENFNQCNWCLYRESVKELKEK